MDPSPILVGREHEMGTLRRLLDAGGGVAVISGEAGIGKSRLAREFAAEAAQRGRIVLWGRPEEVAQPGPYAMIADLLESIVERGGADVKREARALAMELLRPSGVDTQRPPPTARSVAAEVRGLVAQITKQPLILLEDLHRADEVSHSVAMHLSRAASDDGYLVVLTSRAEGAVSEASLSRLTAALVRDRLAETIHLGPLRDQEIAEMLELLWNRAPRPEELGDFIRLAEGVPFFIEELAGLQDDGHRRVPHTIEESVNLKLGTLNGEAVQVVQVASLLAGAVDPAVLAVACGFPQETVAAHLSSAARSGIFADHDGRLVFRHALVRDAVAAGLVSLEAKATHSRIAKAIESVHANELDPFAFELADHYRQGGDRRNAAHYALRAGERSLAFAALDEARAAFTLALQLSDHQSIEALRGLAETEFRYANEEKAAGLFQRAADQLNQKGEVKTAALMLGRLAWTLLGRVAPESVLEVLDQGRNLLTDHENSADYAKLMVQKGGMLTFIFNRHDDALPILEEAAALAERVGDQALVAEAIVGLAHIADAQGEWERELSLFERAVKAASEAQSPEIIGRTHNNHAVCLSAMGKPRQALETLAEAHAVLEKAHGPAAVGALNVTRAWISMLMGEPGEVEALTASAGVAWQRWRAYRRFLEVWAATQLGELERAEQMLSAAWNEVGGEPVRTDWIDNPRPNPEASQILRAEVTLLLRRQLADSAVIPAQALVAVDSLGGERFEQGHSLSLLARVLVMCGRLEEADAQLSTLGSLARRHNYPYLSSTGSEIAGLRFMKLTDFESAIQAFNEAISGFEACDNASDRARCGRLASEAGLSLGMDRRELEERLREARNLAEKSGAADELRHIDAALRAIGIRPRAGRPRKDSSSVAGGLSPREAEVVALVAAGSTNSEIAQRLFLSDRTVQDHVTHALKKLGVSSRAALASWAVRNGMI